MLIDFLDRHCMTANKEADSRNVDADEEPSLSAFDFLYLPIDFVYVYKDLRPSKLIVFIDSFNLFHLTLYCLHLISTVFL